MRNLKGQTFKHRHAAGVMELKVLRKHRTLMHWECVSLGGTGTHNFERAIYIYHSNDIIKHMEAVV